MLISDSASRVYTKKETLRLESHYIYTYMLQNSSDEWESKIRKLVPGCVMWLSALLECVWCSYSTPEACFLLARVHNPASLTLRYASLPPSFLSNFQPDISTLAVNGGTASQTEQREIREDSGRKYYRIIIIRAARAMWDCSGWRASSDTHPRWTELCKPGTALECVSNKRWGHC